MNELPSPRSLKPGAARHLPFDRVVLVLQGGGALGSYQAGVFQALDEAGIPIHWLCGVSIGAVNAALIAGNPPEKRVARLKEYWNAVTEPPISIPPWFVDPWGDSAQARQWANRMSALTAMFYGASNFYTPRPNPPVGTVAERPEDVSYYDTAPLKATLERLVDFDLINAKTMRLTVGASNIQTGAPVYFDNSETKIGVAHIMASGALPPGFPPVEIGGQYYWDGGVVSNSPIQFVIDSRPRHSALVFQVDLWEPSGELPMDITAANLRSLEIHSASRINITLDQFRRQQRARRALARVLDAAAEDLKRDPDVQVLAEEAHAQTVMLVRLKYQTKKYETGSKIFEFSRRSMEEHWRAGYEDTSAALQEPEVLEMPDETETARVFDVRTGWLQ
jgi:NTE family protein